MVTRPWPVPQFSGLAIHQPSDTHIGYRAWSYSEMDRVLDDMSTGLIPPVDVVVHTGDLIDDVQDGSQPLAEQDGYAVPFLANLTGGKPAVIAPGNHDLYGRPTRAAWESVYGRPGNSYVDVKGYRIIGFCPDTFTDDLNWVIPDSTWSWISDLCASAPGPVILADHYPPSELGMGRGSSVQPPASLDALVAGHPNICGFLAGHMHFPIDDARSTELISIGGRSLPLITDNSTVFTKALSRDQLAQIPTITTYIDVVDPQLWKVHYRMHGPRAWGGPSGMRVTTMDLVHGTITHGMS